MSLRDIFDKILNNNLNFKIQDAIDILLVATAIYGLLVLTRKTRASQVLKGLGIFLVKNIMDVVEYERSKDGKNILSMIKKTA